MVEKVIQERYTNFLKIANIEYIHIPASFYLHKLRSGLTFFPDLMFTYRDRIYFREFGIKGNNSKRKEQQFKKMVKWQSQAVEITNIKTIYTIDEVDSDIKKIFEEGNK